MSIKIDKFPEHHEHFYFAGHNTCYCPAVNFCVPISSIKDFLFKLRKSFAGEDNFLTKLSEETGLIIDKAMVERVNPFFSLSNKGIQEEDGFVEIRLKVSYHGNVIVSSGNGLVVDKLAYFIETKWAEFTKTE